VARSSALFLGLAAPETVLAIDASEIPAGEQHRTFGAHLAGGFLTADASFGAFARNAEKEVRATFAGCFTHPRRTICTNYDRLHDCLRKLDENGFSLRR
jgi:hypothetical protein